MKYFIYPVIRKTSELNLSQYLTNLMHTILFYNKFISCLYMFRAPFAHYQEVKIALHSLWYNQTYRCDDTMKCGEFID